MKMSLRHILFVFCLLIAVSFFLSMRSTITQNARNRALLSQVEAENERLQLERQGLEHQLELASEPFVQEQNYRQANLVKREGEQNLELANFEYVPSALPETPAPVPSYREEWQRLFFAAW